MDTQRKPILRRVADATDAELRGALYADIDEPQEDSPWWVIDSLDDLDRALRESVEQVQHAKAMKEYHAAAEKRALDRIERMVRKHEAIIQTVAFVAEGKTRKSVTGDWTSIKYTNTPNKLPKLSIADKDALVEANLFKTSIVIDTEACRKLSDDELRKSGVKVTPQPAVTYTLPSNKAEANNAVSNK